MNRSLRTPRARALLAALSLSCIGVAACLQGTKVTATGGVGGSGGAGGAGGGGTGGDGFGDTSTSSTTDTTDSSTSAADTSSTGPVGPAKFWTFNTSIGTWAISYSDPASLTTDSKASFDSTAGSPTAGSLHVSIPFTDAGQKIGVAVKPTTPLNLTARVLLAKVRLDSGLASDSTGHGEAKLYVKSGASFVYADSGATTLTAGTDWVDLSLTADHPEGFVSDVSYSAAEIVEIGIEISSVGTGAFTAASVHIDTVGYK